MAVFMMASGLCFRAKIDSAESWKKYIVRKINGLYIPFVICNGIFVLLTNRFIRIGIYSNDPELLLISKSWPVQQSLVQPLGLTLYIKKLASVVLFYGATQLGTATWFLTSLFEVLIVNSLIEFALLGRERKCREVIMGIIFVCTLTLSQIISGMDLTHINFAIKCFPVCYASFLLGRILKDFNFERLYSAWAGVVSFVVLVCLSFLFDIEVSAGRIENIAIFLVASLCGWIFLKALATKLMKGRTVSTILEYIGQHTMPILCLHVLSFKVVSLIYILIKQRPWVYLASWHIIFEVNEVWKLLYLLAGVLIPILLYKGYRFIKNKVIVAVG